MSCIFFLLIFTASFLLDGSCRIHRSCVSKAAMRGFVPACLTMSWRMRVVSCWCCLPEEWLSSIRCRSRWKLPAGLETIPLFLYFITLFSKVGVNSTVFVTITVTECERVLSFSAGERDEGEDGMMEDKPSSVTVSNSAFRGQDWEGRKASLCHIFIAGNVWMNSLLKERSGLWFNLLTASCLFLLRSQWHLTGCFNGSFCCIPRPAGGFR